MTIFHLYGDDAGATHLEPLELTLEETAVGTVRSFHGIAAKAADVLQFVNRKPDLGLHASPRRQCFVLLQGVLEVITSLGNTEHLGAGDIFLADDVGTQGHISRDVGDEQLTLMLLTLDPDWDSPSHDLGEAEKT